MAPALPPNTPLPGRQQVPTQLSADSKPPKSKTQPYYSIHPSWSDITPIPQADLSSPATFTSTYPHYDTSTATTLASAGPALASIAYTPRYDEAMSYLRAAMALNEYSQRALALTEDVIGMNPAHYTVWIYRFRVLRSMWGLDDGQSVGGGRDGTDLNEKAKRGIEKEMMWLGGVSERNLKNYQIWHHRTSLVSLFPQDIIDQNTTSQWVVSILRQEPSFLRAILSLDTKNYHVWSYRQWLCSRFPTFFLNDSGVGDGEIRAMDVMIDEDVLNNSAWNHRWFIVFGWRELQMAKDADLQQLSTTDEDTDKDGDGSARNARTQAAQVVDLEVVDRELAYVQSKISIAPQNGSTWNYLKGVLKVSGTSVVDMREFVEQFVGDGFAFDRLDGEEGVKGVRSSQAVEMCVDIFAAESRLGKTDEEKKLARETARQALNALAEQWDPIRRRYWDYRVKNLEAEWKEEDSE